MTHVRITAAITFAATLAASAAFAAAPTSAEYYPFTESALVKTTDKTSAPATVVKQATGTGTTAMGAQRSATLPDQLREILMYMKAGA